MSRLVAIGLILICVTPMFAHTSTAENKIDSSGLDTSTVNDLVIHRGETIEASITVRNLENEKLDLAESRTNISVREDGAPDSDMW
mgnify:CR=1 FL=1